MYTVPQVNVIVDLDLIVAWVAETKLTLASISQMFECVKNVVSSFPRGFFYLKIGFD